MGKSRQAIDASIASRANAFAMYPEDLTVIGLDTKDGPEHHLYDKRILLPIKESLVRDIMRRGVHTAVEVEKDGDAVVIIKGRRRVIHAREANKRLVKEGLPRIKLKMMSPSKLSELQAMGIMISENEQREGDTQMLRAEKCSAFVQRGASLEEAADSFDCNVQTIEAMLDVIGADAAVRDAIDADVLSFTAGQKLSKLSRKEQKEAIVKAKKDGGMTVKKAAATVKAKKSGKRVTVAPPKKQQKGLVKLWNDENTKVPESFIDGVMWTMGELSENEVPGLKDALERIGRK